MHSVYSTIKCGALEMLTPTPTINATKMHAIENISKDLANSYLTCSSVISSSIPPQGSLDTTALNILLTRDELLRALAMAVTMME